MIEKRFSFFIFSIISIIFLIFGLVSAFNYEGVVIQKERIIEVNPGNISLRVMISGNISVFYISVTIKNPSNFNLKMYTFTASIEQHNRTVLQIWRSYYYYTLNPTIIYANHDRIITYSGNVSSAKITCNVFNVSVEIMLRFSGFSYFYENPGENFSPQRYYLTDMVMITIEGNENVTAQVT